MDRFRRMEIFVAIVEAGQLTRAAEALNVSKSAVSQGLNDLERYLDLQLLNRNNRALQLTEAGQSYYEDCKRILDDLQDIEDNVRGEDKSVSGHIKVTAPGSLGSYVLAPILSRFIDLNPGISLDMDMTERHADLIEDGIDVAFRITQLKGNNLMARKISSVTKHICASPDYLARRGEPKSHTELKHHSCLKYTRSPVWRIMKNGRSYDILPKGTILTNSGENMREFAIAGQGIVYMPDFLIAEALQDGRLVEIMPDYTGLSLNIYALRPPHKHCPARVESLIHFVATELKI